MTGVLVLLPCFNEEQALPGLLDRLNRARAALLPLNDVQVLVVDDGSTDATAAITRASDFDMPVELLRHPANQGLGNALDSGIRRFLSMAQGPEQPQLLAVMDADGTHPPELIAEMLARLDGGGGGHAPCDVVIASRYAPGGEEHGLPAIRLFYSRLASACLRVLARVPGVRDYTCGYRLYRRSALARAAERFGRRLIAESSFVCMAELLVKLSRSGARAGEVPLKLHYELKAGPSKLNVSATIWRYVVLAWQLMFNPRWR